jgi:ABC-type transport system substrate-binding protein
MNASITHKLLIILFACVVASCRPGIIVVPVTATFETVATPAIPPDTVNIPTTQSALADLRVRQAIAYCTNRPELIGSVYAWLPDPALIINDSILPRDHWAYSGDEPGFPHYNFDQQLGQALLDEAGWMAHDRDAYRVDAVGNELALKLTTTDTTFRQTWASVWEQQMKDCGIRIVRLHTPANWFFGETTGLQRRDFEIAAFAWIVNSDFDFETVYACNQIPSTGNGWQGMNYTGWCNSEANGVAHVAASAWGQDVRGPALKLIQQQAATDLPAFPLFQRVDVMAINPALQNFSPGASEMYAWNAAHWHIPGKDTITLGQVREPSSLMPFDTTFESRLIRSLVNGVDVAALDYAFTPLTLDSLPAPDKDIFVNLVKAEAGTVAVDATGKLVTLSVGDTVMNMQDEVETLYGGSVWMKQNVVTYRFKENLVWADGEPVIRDDYKLAYTVACDPETAAPELLTLNYTCQYIQSVEFLDDTAYMVTWQPGFDNGIIALPPIWRMPSHQFLSDGRQLDETPFSDWARFPEVAEYPMGIGPYTVTEWVRGSHLKLDANPYYFGGQVTTPHIIVRFFNSPGQAVDALIQGRIDILGSDAIDASGNIDTLLNAKNDGLISVIILPTNVYEHIDFNLTAP